LKLNNEKQERDSRLDHIKNIKINVKKKKKKKKKKNKKKKKKKKKKNIIIQLLYSIILIYI